MKRSIILINLLILSSITYIASQGNEKNYAHCNLNQFNNSGVTGVVKFSQLNTGGDVTIEGDITKVPKNATQKNGFHIHVNAITGLDCNTAGAHFNPDNVDHGGPTDQIRHVGDLGNISSDSDGEAEWSTTDSKISLVSGNANNIIGKSCVLHSGEDDLGRGQPSDESKLSGNSGTRLACGTIVITETGIRYITASFILVLAILGMFF